MTVRLYVNHEYNASTPLVSTLPIDPLRLHSTLDTVFPLCAANSLCFLPLLVSQIITLPSTVPAAT